MTDQSNEEIKNRRESYSAYTKRTSYQDDEQFSTPESFELSDTLNEKVMPDNTLRPFFGDTVVFELAGSVKAKVGELTDILYKKAPECFCERLSASTMHMTMHDLGASVSEEQAAVFTRENEAKLIEILKENPIVPQKIHMRTRSVVTMVDKSLIYTLEPVSEEDWEKLQDLYVLINNVAVCPYPYLTPHITLAYYNINGFDDDSRKKLNGIVKELDQVQFDVTLDTEKLYYQHFYSMNHYENIFPLASI